MHSNQDKVRSTLRSIIQLFESGNAPQAIAHVALPRPEIPASKWSLGNNLLLWFAGTGDARGFRQWNAVGRHARKGAKAIYILAPNLTRRHVVSTSCPPTDTHLAKSNTCKTIGEVVKETRGIVQHTTTLRRKWRNDPVPPETRTDATSGQSILTLTGFLAVPVFRFEDTDGAELQHDLNPPELPPLAEVAAAWGLTVRYVGCSGPYLGFYRHNSDRAHEITLATHDEQVFFHELAHAAQYRVWTDLKPEQKLRKEIAAELAACALARLCGRKSSNDGASYQYIRAYCANFNKPVDKTLWSLLSDTEQILHAILSATFQTQTA